MNGLVLHPVTEAALNGFLQQPGQSLILAGPSGSGKAALALSVTSTVLGIETDRFAEYPYKSVIVPEGTSIGIDAVRTLEHFFSLKVPGQAAYNRAVIIEQAQLLTIEAQNALLKLLEEPPAGTILILAVDNEQNLLPTIRSRAPVVAVKRPGRQRLEAFFADQHESAAVVQALAVSGGLPGLMQALLADTDHPLLLATQKARQLLSQTPYERLLLVDELSKQRQLARDVTFILQQMAHISLQTAPPDKAKRWQAVLQASYQAGEALAGNAQPKLALTDLMLSF
jgi:DNA polymerase III, delta subunit